MLATLRSDGFPRISPIEPRIFEWRLIVGGMPGTTKFRDLTASPTIWRNLPPARVLIARGPT